MDVFTAGECLRLLSAATFGRVGASAGALPVVVPVPCAVVDDAVLFDAGEAPELGSLHDAVVALQADGLSEADPVAGWHVLVVGPAHEITSARELSGLAAHGIVSGPRSRWFRLAPHRVSGRRCRFP